MSRLRRLITVLAWDGMLPVAVVAIVTYFKFAVPARDAEIFVAVLVPVFACLFRAAIAHHQITALCGGTAPVSRQIAIAVAIVSVFLFEFFASILTLAKGPDPIAWLIPLGFYVLYLATIVWALRPVRESIET